jgi:hypothetical protein
MIVTFTPNPALELTYPVDVGNETVAAGADSGAAESGAAESGAAGLATAGSDAAAPRQLVGAVAGATGTHTHPNATLTVQSKGQP